MRRGNNSCIRGGGVGWLGGCLIIVQRLGAWKSRKKGKENSQLRGVDTI